MWRCPRVGATTEKRVWGRNMLKWLLRKNEDARIYMCIKEVKWELQAADPLKRATILAMAQLVHETTIDEAIAHALNHPLDRSREFLIELYRGLEDVRNRCRLELDATKTSMRRFGMELPQFSVEHAKITERGVEVWMCTVGAGISPHLRDEVRQIWAYLVDARGHVELAIEKLRDIERRTCEMTGAAGMFPPMSDEQWEDLCGYVPTMFRGRLA
jgi:hypothetical protein